ncbi:hypothetical protein KY342_03600, partial [Candidatus Woesearchaeota archaeon]|nr:hypothetical protein [Candidatus Woesearchaeota archaeon]
ESIYFTGKIDEVRIYNRSISHEEINASYNASMYRYNISFNDYPDGNYSYVAYAQDKAGNVNNTETRQVTFDSTPPEIYINNPVNNTIT